MVGQLERCAPGRGSILFTMISSSYERESVQDEQGP